MQHASLPKYKILSLSIVKLTKILSNSSPAWSMQTSVLEAHKVLAFNVPVAAEGLQRRSKLEKAMQEWFAEQGQRLKFVLWGPGGTGKSTLALKFAAGQAKDAVPRSPVRLVFALSRSSMVEGYAGLLGESCMYVRRP